MIYAVRPTFMKLTPDFRNLINYLLIKLNLEVDRSNPFQTSLYPGFESELLWLSGNTVQWGLEF